MRIWAEIGEYIPPSKDIFSRAVFLEIPLIILLLMILKRAHLWFKTPSALSNSVLGVMTLLPSLKGASV